jgi:hypothetical protein
MDELQAKFSCYFANVWRRLPYFHHCFQITFSNFYVFFYLSLWHGLLFYVLQRQLPSLFLFSVRLSNPNPRTYIGSGKVSEIRSAIQALDVETVIFDDELSPG